MDERTFRLEWFKTTILPHEGYVRARLRRLCPAGFDVENLVAESLARAYAAKDIARIKAGQSYLFTIARNLMLDAARRDTIVSLDFVADLDTLRSTESLEAALTARDELRRLHAIIETLPEQPRRVFLMRRVYDYSPGDIAAELVLSVSTVEKHLAKAIQLVAKGMAEVELTSLREERVERPAQRQAGQPTPRRAGVGALGAPARRPQRG
jgi:RNA polymerase sigma factor (sigma-70 family)